MSASSSPRTILHVDLDAFYASVEQRDNPLLRGKPVVVAGPAPRGVVAAASYEARRFGIKSAIPTAHALKLCPQAIVIFPRMRHYAESSERFFDILHSYSPLVEGLSLDEAFVDVTSSATLFGSGPEIARAIKQRVRSEVGLVASVGIAPSKFVAKVASDLGKPDGLLVVAPSEVVSFLAPLPVGRLWGVGEVTEQSLATIGIRTVGDVAALGVEHLALRLGRERAEHLARLAVGDDDRPVDPERAAVSVGSEDTFDKDLHAAESLHAPLLAQADLACARLRKMQLRAHTVTIKVKYSDHKLITRRCTLERATSDERVVGEAAIALLRHVPEIARGVRLTGVTLSGFEAPGGPAQQLTFDAAFDAAGDAGAAERGEKLGETLDAIRSRFGRAAVKRAVHLDEDEVAPRSVGPKKPER